MGEWVPLESGLETMTVSILATIHTYVGINYKLQYASTSTKILHILKSA